MLGFAVLNLKYPEIVATAQTASSKMKGQTLIGAVTKVEYTDKGNYLVKVAVKNQYSSLPRDSSIFYIDSNPENGSKNAIRILQIEDDGNIIEKDATVDGQSKYVAIYGQIAN